MHRYVHIPYTQCRILVWPLKYGNKSMEIPVGFPKCCHTLSPWDAEKLEACEPGKHQNKSQESGGVKGKGQV